MGQPERRSTLRADLGRFPIPIRSFAPIVNVSVDDSQRYGLADLHVLRSKAK